MRNAELTERHLRVSRTARYFTVGGAAGKIREVWYVLHGYGQLAQRFLASFDSLADSTRLIVAPEGLSRFYLDAPGSAPAAQRRVGASWMTREDRLAEIEDYIRYLDDVHADVRRLAGGDAMCMTVLGFSQGTAAACRWVVRGAARPERLILWGGEIPPELESASLRERFGQMDLILVAGRSDPLITAKIVARDTARLRAEGIEYQLIEFDGGHEIEAQTLQKIGDAGRGTRDE